MISKPEETLAPVGLAILRIALGVVLVVGGWKLAFPADSQALVASYTNQASGWIADYFGEWIESIGLTVLQFLTLLGWLEMTVGALLIVGFGTPVVAFLAGIMFFSFPIANPVAGMVRLARDVMLGGFALAVAFTGTGAWNLSALRGQVAEFRPEKKHFFLGTIRLATLYALVMAVLFPWGAGASPLNQTMVWWILLPATVLLGLNVGSRWIMALVGLWMLVVVSLGVLRGVGAQGFAGLYWGLDAVKREVGLMAAASVYALLGPDQISFLPRMGHTVTPRLERESQEITPD